MNCIMSQELRRQFLNRPKALNAKFDAISALDEKAVLHLNIGFVCRDHAHPGRVFFTHIFQFQLHCALPKMHSSYKFYGNALRV